MTVNVEDVERVLAQLRDPDKQLRNKLMGELRAWEKEPLSPAAAHRLLQAATDEYPAVEGWPATPNEQLVSMLSKGAQVDPAVALEVYPRLNVECRAWVLRLLASLASKEASAALARLLSGAREGAGLPDVHWPVLLPLERAPRHPELLAGPLSRCLEANIWPRGVASALLGYAKARLLALEQRQVTAAAAATRLSDLLTRLSSLDREHRWEGEYQSMRSEAGLLLDLVGELKVDGCRNVLAVAVQHQDPWIVLWGALGLLRSNVPVSDEAIERVAADAESRLPLFDCLAALGQTERYPTKYRNQSALAESNMVRWLIYPTELGRGPDEMEEIAILPLTTKDGMADLYMYRFRTFEPHWAAKDGWMVGAAGPFLRSEQPTTRSLGATFSRFEKFDTKTIEDHSVAILDTLTDWRRAAGRA
jgi:hypothetical protein